MSLVAHADAAEFLVRILNLHWKSELSLTLQLKCSFLFVVKTGLVFLSRLVTAVTANETMSQVYVSVEYSLIENALLLLVLREILLSIYSVYMPLYQSA